MNESENKNQGGHLFFQEKAVHQNSFLFLLEYLSTLRQCVKHYLSLDMFHIHVLMPRVVYYIHPGVLQALEHRFGIIFS